MSEGSINHRIIELINRLADGKQKVFANEIDISPSTISTIVGTRGTKPGWEVLNAIVSRYENVNSDWLLRGKGEMLNEKAANANTQLKFGDKNTLNDINQIAHSRAEIQYGNLTEENTRLKQEVDMLSQKLIQVEKSLRLAEKLIKHLEKNKNNI
jgi:hypothetical protein